MDILIYCLLIVMGYLYGSIPFALVIGKLFYHTDVRNSGSGNLGGTNAGRVLGKKAGLSESDLKCPAIAPLNKEEQIKFKTYLALHNNCSGKHTLMLAVCKHELRMQFHSLTAYVFGAFLLAVVGIGAMLYNLQAAVSNFEYVLSFSSLVFAVIVPLLTMRSLAEERRQRTDQLLYALPLSTWEVILGKYLALLAVFAVPLCVIAVYPLLFAQFGEVYLPTSYGSLFAYFLLGAALIAVGVFLSSLTDNQGFAAGISVAVILFNYYSVALSEYAAATAQASALALFVLAAGLGLLVKALTRSENLAIAVGLPLMALVVAAYFFNSSWFEGLLPNVMAALSLFERLNVFVNGVFDLTAVVFYLSVAAFFLFLSVQSLEKRRYN